MPRVNAKFGFLLKCRTSDHIFTLQILIDKYVHQNKGNIFAYFIDFKKAFDSIWHEGLYLKLIDSGIGGKLYDLIKSMYTASQCVVKIGNQRTEFFPQGRGVRLQFKPHPLQHLHQSIGQHIRTRPHSRSHSTRHRDKVSSLRR